MSDTSLVFNLIGRDQGATNLIARTSTQVRAANVASAASVGVLGIAAVSATAQVIALASGVAQASGAIVAMPALAITAAAGIGVFKLGVLGLGAALKKSAGAAGGAAFDYAGAEHRVAMAVRASLDAQKALDVARASAAESIADLTRSLNGARLDEEGAVLAVARAEADLRKARRGGNAKQIQDADFAYRQSLQTLEEAKDRTQDLAAKQADASTKGVEGSDAVQQALQRQSDATYDLIQAQKALAKGASGGGGGADPAAAAFAKLAPSAQALVTTIKAIAPAWQTVQRTVQQAVWAGVAGDLRVLSATYLPVATTQLTRFGTAWNIAIRQTAGFLKTPAAVRLVDQLLGNAATAAQTFGRAVQPLVSAFLMLGAAGSSTLPGLANTVLSLALRFERFIAAAKESGKLAQWASTGMETLRNLATIAWNVAASIVAIFRAGGASEGQGMLVWLAEATGRMSAFLNSTEGQDKISKVLATLRDVVSSVAAGLSELNTDGASFGETFKASSVIIGFLADNLGFVAAHLPEIAAAFVIYKTAQMGANVASMFGVGIQAIALIRNWGMVGALTAHTAALTANTAATATSAGVTTASGVAAGGASVGFWALTAALLANPITWIVLAIIALIAIIVLIATKTRWFQEAWNWAWGGIKAGAAAVWDWISGVLWPGLQNLWLLIVAGATWVKEQFGAAWGSIKTYASTLWDYLGSLPGKLRDMFLSIVGFISAPFRTAFNAVASAWNNTIGRLSWSVPAWVPFLGGNTISAPRLPTLDVGGQITATGLAIVHEGEQVVPAARTEPYRERGGMVLRLEMGSGGSSLERAAADGFLYLIRKGVLALKVDERGRVQVA